MAVCSCNMYLQTLSYPSVSDAIIQMTLTVLCFCAGVGVQLSSAHIVSLILQNLHIINASFRRRNQFCQKGNHEIYCLHSYVS